MISNDIVIDTTPPYVIAVLSLREGVYTMGQSVDLQVPRLGTKIYYHTHEMNARPIYWKGHEEVVRVVLLQRCQLVLP